ncbi:MAG: C1 family peptidase [Chloroflexota bacterium]
MTREVTTLNGTQQRITNCLPSKKTPEDWLLTTASEAGYLNNDEPIPPTVDLRAPWWTIGDQLDSGACVGWAVADGVVRWHLVKADRLHPEQQLSSRFIWVASKEMDEYRLMPTTFIESDGTSLKSALNVAYRWGAVPEEMLPFNTTHLYDGDKRVFFATAAKYRISAYFDLTREPENWKQWIAHHGPILARVEVDTTWMNALQTFGELEFYDPEINFGGHAVTIVGYGPDSFIIRNSWGTDWGDEGFAYASMAYVDAAITEAYGIAA